MLNNRWILLCSLQACCAPFSVIVDQLEFRIFKAIFCNLNHLQQSVPFHDYVTVVFEKYILGLIEIRPMVRHAQEYQMHYSVHR